jgi:type IV pilus assembly protein PilC
MIDWLSHYIRDPNAAPRVDSRSVAVFTRQLATLLLGGVPILKAMEVLAYQPDNPKFGQVIEVCTKQICSGSRLSSSLRMFPTVFPSTYVALVRVGEETGSLHHVMEQLSIWLERSDRLSQVIKKALAYPVFVAIITAILTVALFRTVIPAILKTVVDLGVELPWADASAGGLG